MATFRGKCEATMNSLCGPSGSLRSSISSRVSSRVSAGVLAGTLFLLAVTSGCATTKIYHLNLDPTTYPVTLGAIANTAGDMGYQVTHLATAVNVRYDKDTWIYYSLGEHDYGMAIVVTNDVASNLVNGRIDEAKAKGEEIWSKVLASRQTGKPNQPAAPGATPHSL